MDSKAVKHPEILRLIRQSEASRSCLAAEAAVFRRKLDVPSRVRESLGRHPLAWLLGSVGSGLAASLLFHRKPAVTGKSSRGIKSALFGLAFKTARPLLEAWLIGRLKNLAGGMVGFPAEPISAPLTSRKIKKR
ncbi:MAG: hypothetical protein WCS43_06595 [Verrucomicrobiota bacterium]